GRPHQPEMDRVRQRRNPSLKPWHLREGSMRTPGLDRYAAIIRLPFGPMGVVCDAQTVQELAFLPPDTPEKPPATALAAQAVTALQAWIANPDRPHGLPLRPQGTDFQRRV